MLRIGLIGCGEYCSSTHAQVLSRLDHVQIVAISDCILPGELAQRREQFHIPFAFSSYVDMLASIELDAVVISTPHALHFNQTKYCLEHSLHVMVDKPPAFRSKDVQTLVDVAESKGCHLLVVSQRRYDPLICRFRDKICNEELGKLKFIELHYARSRRPNFTTSWRNNPAMSGGGVLIDAGYHIIDSLLWITKGQPLHVSGELNKIESNVETTASITLRLGESTLANISIHLEMPPNMVWEEIGFYGSKDSFVYQRESLPNNVSSARLIEVRSGQQSYEEIQKNKEIDQAPAKNFINAILGQEPIVSSGKESINTVRTIEWIYRELQNKNGESEKDIPR